MVEKRTAQSSTASVEDMARLFGCDIRTLQKLAAAKIIIKAGHGRYERDASTKAYVAHLREMASGRGAKGTGADGPSESDLLKREQRYLAMARRRILERDVIPVEEIAPAWARVIKSVRRTVLAIPTVARLRLPHLTPHDVVVLDEIVRDALQEASDDHPPPIDGADVDAHTENA